MSSVIARARGRRSQPPRAVDFASVQSRARRPRASGLHTIAPTPSIDESYAPVVAAVARLLDACAADGSVRQDLAPADILLLMGFLWRVSPDDDGREQGRRLMQIVFDGIRRNPTRHTAAAR